LDNGIRSSLVRKRTKVPTSLPKKAHLVIEPKWKAKRDNIFICAIMLRRRMHGYHVIS